MKTKKTLILGCAISAISIFQAQTAPAIEWQKSYGGSGSDYANSLQQTADGGYIIAGDTESVNGDVTDNLGFSDGWLIKLNASGTVEWQKTIGGSSYDYAKSVLQDTNGNYVVGGYSYTVAGGRDYWVVKLNASGDIIWQKTLGGSGADTGYSICQSTDGSYIIAGYTNSSDGDVTGNHGGYDFWLAKLDTSGNLVWQKTLGGTDSDVAFFVSPTTDGGCVATGYSESNNGDVTGNHGNYPGGGRHDYWAVKLDSYGNLEWQKSLGGSGEDIGTCIRQTAEGGYIISGYTKSGNGDVNPLEYKGNTDYWVVKLNPSGNVEWKRTLGGSLEDHSYSVWQTMDGNYIVAGETYSPNTGDVTDNHGSFDAWIVKLNTLGNLVWQKSFGGSKADSSSSIQQTTDGGFVFAGVSNSADGNVSDNHGNYDFWVVKLSPDQPLAVQDVKNANINIYPNPVKDVLRISGAVSISDVEIYDISGKKVSEMKDVKNRQMNIHYLPKGSYLLKGLFDQQQHTLKIIKE